MSELNLFFISLGKQLLGIILIFVILIIIIPLIKQNKSKSEESAKIPVYWFFITLFIFIIAAPFILPDASEYFPLRNNFLLYGISIPAAIILIVCIILLLRAYARDK